MKKYTSNEKLSEKKMSSATRKKIIGMLLAGVVTISTSAGALYAAYRGDIDKSNDVKNYNMPYKISQGTKQEPAFSKFMNENIDEIKKIQRDLITYKDLLDIPNPSNETKKKIDDMATKINNEYGTKIEIFSLRTVKSKLADTYRISPEDIAIKANMQEQIISIKNKETGKVLLDPSSQLVMKEAIIDLVKLQNSNIRNSLDSARHANSLTILFGKTLEVGSKTYKISRNNELLEIDMKEKDKSSDPYVR